MEGDGRVERVAVADHDLALAQMRHDSLSLGLGVQGRHDGGPGMSEQAAPAPKS
jgi:hypothetical protein